MSYLVQILRDCKIICQTHKQLSTIYNLCLKTYCDACRTQIDSCGYWDIEYQLNQGGSIHTTIVCLECEKQYKEIKKCVQKIIEKKEIKENLKKEYYEFWRWSMTKTFFKKNEVCEGHGSLYVGTFKYKCIGVRGEYCSECRMLLEHEQMNMIRERQQKEDEELSKSARRILYRKEIKQNLEDRKYEDLRQAGCNLIKDQECTGHGKMITNTSRFVCRADGQYCTYCFYVLKDQQREVIKRQEEEQRKKEEEQRRNKEMVEYIQGMYIPVYIKQKLEKREYTADWKLDGCFEQSGICRCHGSLNVCGRQKFINGISNEGYCSECRDLLKKKQSEVIQRQEQVKKEEEQRRNKEMVEYIQGMYITVYIKQKLEKREYTADWKLDGCFEQSGICRYHGSLNVCGRQKFINGISNEGYCSECRDLLKKKQSEVIQRQKKEETQIVQCAERMILREEIKEKLEKREYTDWKANGCFGDGSFGFDRCQNHGGLYIQGRQKFITGISNEQYCLECRYLLEKKQREVIKRQEKEEEEETERMGYIKDRLRTCGYTNFMKHRGRKCKCHKCGEEKKDDGEVVIYYENDNKKYCEYCKEDLEEEQKKVIKRQKQERQEKNGNTRQQYNRQKSDKRNTDRNKSTGEQVCKSNKIYCFNKACGKYIEWGSPCFKYGGKLYCMDCKDKSF